jgi:hypothetical protein
VQAALDANNLTQNFFPDYNLDADRGYAWPCWDVAGAPPHDPASDLDPAQRPAPVTVAAAVIP